MYDVVAGKRCIKSSYYISKAKALELFPMLRKEDLCGALIYYDGTSFTYLLTRKLQPIQLIFHIRQGIIERFKLKS